VVGLASFPYDRDLYSLFKAQYLARDKARKAGYRKWRITHWAFSPQENDMIPNFYERTNALVRKLVRAKVLRTVLGVVGEIEVRDCIRSYEVL
jgi:hypothetical protein